MKKITTLPVLLSLSALLAAGSALAVVFPADGDTRDNLPTDLARSTGTIYCDGAVRGTAALLETGAKRKSVILSAAHIFADSSGKPYQQCRYHPQNRRLSGIALGDRQSGNFRFLDENRIRQSESDWVLITLQQVVNQPGLALYSGAISAQQPLQLIGYNAKRDAIQLAGPCYSFPSQRFHSDLLLFHNCDSEGGASGGPILVTEGGRTMLAAIHGGTLIARQSTDSPPQPERHRANPEQLINQARKVDAGLLEALAALRAAAP